MKDFELFTKVKFWLAIFSGLGLAVVSQYPDKKLHLYFCDVGQGDAALITYQSAQILIDGGPDARVLDCLAKAMPFWDRKIEVVVNTHPEKDHLTGLVDVLLRYRVKYLLVNSHARETAEYKKFLEVVAAEGAEVSFPVAGEGLRMGELSLNFLWPADQPQVLGAMSEVKDVNETSLVAEVDFGEFEALLTGDISRETEEKLDLRDQEVIKIAHHGSRFSTGEELLKRTKPELAVISVGKNLYGHPTGEVLRRLSGQAIRIWRTDEAGTIEIVTDGREWEVKK